MKPLLALLLLGFAHTAHAQATVSADTPGRTASGVQYVQPKDWSAQTTDTSALFISPEGDLRLTVLEIGAHPSAEAAAEAAWRKIRAQAAPVPRLVTKATPANGWDERASLAYETAPTEAATRAALALRKGTAWTVLIIEGAAATAAKRSAALNVVQNGLQAPGYTQESFAGKTAHPLTPARIKQLTDFVASSATALGVPGVGLALIDQGQVVWEGGIGVRALGSPEPVNAQTKFMIASNTKGMATLLLSVLADEGKLGWNQPVVDLYPEFRLGSAETTAATEVRHLVCACTGLPRKDYSFILADPGAPASDTFRQLAQTEPTSSFGELFQYNNLMASAAGYLGGTLSYPGKELGSAFDKAMHEKIFRPLGMIQTGFDFEAGMAGNWAPPHGLDINGQMVRMSNDFNATVYPHRPAGGAFSSTADMARYVQLELTKGLARNGSRIVSEANLLERRKRGVQVTEDSWYGMGLFERNAWDIPVVTHGGTLVGYHSNWYALPQAGVGAVILTNADPGAALLAPFLRRLLEVLYDGEPQAAAEVAAAAARQAAQADAKRARVTFPADPAVLANLATHYRAPDVGSIHITERDGGKTIKAGFVEGPVATRANADGSVSIVSVGPGIIGVEAVVGTSEGKRTLTISDGQQSRYVYVEQP